MDKRIFYTYKTIIITIILFAFILPLKAQVQLTDQSKEVTVNANLNSILDLNMDPEITVTFEFIQIDQGNFMIVNRNEQIMFSVESTANWRLEYAAAETAFQGWYDPSNQVELNNVGVRIQCMGSHQDNGVNLINHTQNGAVALGSRKSVLLEKGIQSNIGDATANTFLLTWEIGTRSGNMNQMSIIFQNVSEDIYMVNVDFTLTEDAFTRNTSGMR